MLKKINLKNKTALVTGAGKGLGKACAVALAEAGAKVIITVDTLVAGNREKDHRTGFTTPPKLTLESLMSFAMRPSWVFNYLTGKKFELSNIKKKQIRELVLRNQLLNTLTNNTIHQWAGRMPSTVQKSGMVHLL